MGVKWNNFPPVVQELLFQQLKRAASILSPQQIIQLLYR
jgi:hypothetical protein